MSETLHILIVEDNPADVDLIRESLPETGDVSFRIESVSRLSDAVSRLKHGGIDLVLTDLGLPDSQGLDTFRRFKKAAPDIPVIVLTANNDEGMALVAMMEGAQDYLVKGQIGVNMVMRSVRYAVERKRADEALQESNRELQEALKKLQDLQKQMIQQERLIALGQMASGIAHDFNNALMPVLGYVDLLLSSPDILNNRKETVGKLELVRAGALNAIETVRRLREFYRPSDLPQLRPIDLAGVIRNTVEMTRLKWEEEMKAKGIPIDIRTEIAPVPPVMGDEHELNQLLTNLILNAVEAMPKGGSITMRLHPHASGKHAVFEVQDTGIGMSEEMRRRCLEPFFTTKSGRGVGLGLSVSYGIVQRHNGSIEIHSEPGKGARIVVKLPLEELSEGSYGQGAPDHVPPEEQRRRSAAAAARRPPGRGECDLEGGRPLPPVPSLRVLFVDDEESARLLLDSYLKADGHTVTLAADGREGLTIFKAGRFDVVILDRAMPGMSGDELAAAIKSVSPETPVIMLTGFGNVMEERGEHPVGVDKIVAKPLTRETLRRAIAEVMA